ncbi:MAG: FixH family protein [Pseudomonadota bacterium]
MIMGNEAGDDRKPGKGKINGYHVTAMLVAFFGVIIAVNLVMARYAISSFGGTVVDNSYVASQKYNDWLEAARAQQRYGWTIAEPLRQDGHVVMRIAMTEGGGAMTGASITAEAMHPVGRSDSFTFTFSETAPGVYRSVDPVPQGRWKLQISIDRAGQTYRMRSEIL